MSEEGKGEPATPARELVHCPNCDRDVPPGEFCGACGAHLLDSAGPAHRRHAFAAHPGEHVVHLSVVSTLLPHLPHRSAAPFRIGLVVAAVVLVAFGLLRLTGPTIALAAAAVPVLYLIYLYEVEVYEDEPLWIIGSTVVLGVVLGAIWALVTGAGITQSRVVALTHGPDAGAVLVSGILVPVVAQLLMLVGALFIFMTRRFYDEALDGFTFGAAGALGFSFATTLVDLFPDLSQGLFSSAPALLNTMEIVQRGLLIPIINASTTGLIAGSLWLWRGESRAAARHRQFSSLPAAVAVAILVQAVLGVAGIVIPDPTLVVVVYALAAGLLLVWVRVAIHHMLLAEAVEVAIGPPMVCSHCHRMVPRMAFCAHCGIATRATPKTGEGRAGRAVRKV
ncbi:MAG TPA: zinc ribbon domain-containing protein [Candidatus Dormibacteraeota bacterium]